MIRAVLRIGCKGIQLFRFNALCGQFSTRAVVRRSVTGPRAQVPGPRPELSARNPTQESIGNTGIAGTARTAETEQPEPQKPPESRAPATAGPAGRNAKNPPAPACLREPEGSAPNAPAGTFRKSIRSIAAALRRRDSGPQGSASSYFAARSSPSSSTEPTTRSS